VRDGEGRPLHSASAVTGRMRLDIEFADGRVAAVADGEGAPAPAVRPKPRPRGGEGSGGQGSLFGL
jgi:exodeoxyribonuclease VII large subunit